MQIALLAADPSGAAQATALREIAKRATTRDAELRPSRRPFRLDVLPTNLTVADALARTGPEQSQLGWALVGVGGDEVRGVGVNLFEGAPTFLIAGPPKSGRSTVLATMVTTLIAGGASVVVLAPRPSPLRALEGSPGVAAVLTGMDVTEEGSRPCSTASRTACSWSTTASCFGMPRPRTGCATWCAARATAASASCSRGHRRRGERIQRLAGRGAQEPQRHPAQPAEHHRRRPGRGPAAAIERQLRRATGGLANLGDGELTLLQLPTAG